MSNLNGSTNIKKTNLVIGAIFGLLFIFSSSSAQAAVLSQSMIPQSLEGLPLLGVAEADKETAFGFNVQIEEGFKAVYQDANTKKSIFVNVFYGKSDESISSRINYIIPESKALMEEQVGSAIQFGVIEQVYIGSQPCPYIAYQVQASGTTYYGNILAVGIGRFMLFVHTMTPANDLGLDKAKEIAQFFLDQLPLISPTTSPTSSAIPSALPSVTPTAPVNICTMDTETTVGKMLGADVTLRMINDCIYALLSELNPLVDATEIFNNIGCGVFYKLLDGLYTLDVNDPKSVEETTKKVNEGVAQILLAMADAADWWIAPLKLLEVFSCLDNVYGFSTKAVELATGAISQGLYYLIGMPSYFGLVKSPADILVETSRGKVGVDEKGNVYKEIPGSAYIKFKNSDVKVVMIRNIKEEDKPVLKAFATEEGKVGITTLETSKKGEYDYKEYNNIVVNPETIITFEQGKNPVVDANGDGSYNPADGDRTIEKPDVEQTAKIGRKKSLGKYIPFLIIGLMGLAIIIIIIFYFLKKKQFPFRFKKQ